MVETFLQCHIPLLQSVLKLFEINYYSSHHKREASEGTAKEMDVLWIYNIKKKYFLHPLYK